MPFPLAHPVAALPLRRFCPRHFDFSALVLGSLLPDMAYAIDDLNKFSRTVRYVFGSVADNLTCVKNAWDWDDLSHTFFGSLGFCVPLGLLLLMVFFSLRSALVRVLPDPHRAALLPLCAGDKPSWRTYVISLLVGIWIHIGWDSLTNSDRWLGQHWDLLRVQMAIGATKIDICRLFWIFSSLGGLLALTFSYLQFLKARRSSGWFYQCGELRYYLLWLAVLLISGLVAIPLALQFANLAGSIDERLAFLHRFSGYYIAIFGGGIILVTLASKWQERRVNPVPTQSEL